MDESPNIVYYNMTFVNNYEPTNNPSYDQVYVPAQFSQYRNQAIVDRPEDYYASVIRMEVDASTIPITIFPQDSSGNPDNNYYIVSLTTAAQPSNPVGVIYVPSAIFGLPLGETPIYSYQEFLDMINTAFNTAFNNLTVKPPGYTIAPYLYMDTTTNIISLVTQSQYADNAVRIWMNVELYQFFYNFNAEYAPLLPGETTISQPLNYRFRIKYYGDNLYTNTFVDINNPPNLIASALLTSQEFENLQAWQVLRKIVITSNLPVQIEAAQVGTQNIGTSSNRYLPILTDYAVPIDQRVGGSRSTIIYLPTAEFRLTSMTGKDALKSLAFQVYWEDRFQNIRPILVGPAQGFNLKLMFRKKSYNGPYEMMDRNEKLEEAREKEIIYGSKLRQLKNSRY